MAKKFVGIVLENRQLTEDIYTLKINVDDAVYNALMGQFIHIKCSDSNDPLLRRPISLLDVNIPDKTFDIVYQVKGIGTKYLANKKVGDTLDIIGPIGNSFDVSDNNKHIAVIGGGIGIFPLYYLLKNIKSNKDAFLGFRNKNNIVMEKDFHQVASNLYISTDDGSYGYNGIITDKFQECLKNKKYDMIYACGPVAMLNSVVEVAKLNNIKCQVSLEQRMGCGIGACLVCACKTKKDDDWAYKHVCKDGPVFNSEEVILDE